MVATGTWSRRVLKQPFEIGYQPEGPLTAVPFDRVQSWTIRKCSWLADRGQATIALAILLASLQLPR